MSTDDERRLDELLVDDDGLHAVTRLKHHPRDHSLRQINREIRRGESLRPLFVVAERIVAQAELSAESVRFYASLVDYYTVYKLKRMEPATARLYLLCFVRDRYRRLNVQHPTYKAFAELGKAVKTVFLCRYLGSKALRREIHEGLNVVEQWNGATDFVFFARRGEMSSNRREDHEASMLALHLIQNCMVYINTLMIQSILERPRWERELTGRDYAALTPLIWAHVNP